MTFAVSERWRRLLEASSKAGPRDTISARAAGLALLVELEALLDLGAVCDSTRGLSCLELGRGSAPDPRRSCAADARRGGDAPPPRTSRGRGVAATPPLHASSSNRCLYVSRSRPGGRETRVRRPAPALRRGSRWNLSCIAARICGTRAPLGAAWPPRGALEGLESADGGCPLTGCPTCISSRSRARLQEDLRRGARWPDLSAFGSRPPRWRASAVKSPCIAAQ